LVFILLRLPTTNAFQRLSYRTNHSKDLFVTSLNSLAVLPAHRLCQGQHLSCTAPILTLGLIPWVSYRNIKEREEEGKKSKRDFSD